MSIRKLTDEQFADGTTIDGNRVERALADSIGRLNALEPSDLNRRWTQSQFVWGYQPAVGLAPGADEELPWLLENNIPYWVHGSQPEQGVQNLYRVKGAYLKYTLADGPPRRWVWTNSWYFESPVIIRTVHMSFHATKLIVPSGDPSVTLAEFNNTFQWGSGTGGYPPSEAINEFVSDVVVQVAVDNPFSPELASEAAIEMHRSNFRVDNQLLRPRNAAVEAQYPTMPFEGLPPLPTDTVPDPDQHAVPSGLAIISDNLNIPIPRRSRVRVHVVIPDWFIGDDETRTSPWGWTAEETPILAYPWSTQFYSGSMTILEPLEE